LPEYMVPAAYVHLEALPLTPNGKLDRRALPALGDAAYATREFEPPIGPVEQTLARLWSELLGVPRVGRQDDFFELGGHSLLAITLLERMSAEGLPAEVRALFEAPTLAALAAMLIEEGAVTAGVAVPPNLITPQTTVITPEMVPLATLSQDSIDRIVAGVPGGVAGVQDIYALSPLQEGILFHHLLDAQTDPYAISYQMVMADRSQVDRYLAALQATIDRHDILRSAVVWDGLEEPVQVVWRHAQLPVSEIELDPAAGPAHEQLALRYAPRSWRMKLAQAPLLHVVVARDPSTGRWWFRVLWHHLIGDHSSIELLQLEVQAQLAGRQQALPPVQPFRNLMAEVRLGNSAEEQTRYFREVLGDVSEPCAPFDLLDAQGDGSATAEAQQPLDDNLSTRLRLLARGHGVTVATLCHLAWAQVVARTSRSGDAVFGTVLFGRMHPAKGAGRTIGMLINTLPMRVRVDGTPVAEALLGVHRQLSMLLRHEHASLVLAQRASAVPAPAPLFTSLLNYRHQTSSPATDESFMRGTMETLHADRSLDGIEDIGGEERTNYPIGLSVEDFGDQLSLSVQTTAPVAPQRVGALMKRALEVLADALEHAPHTPLRDLDIVPESERSACQAWNATERPFAQQRCLHELFEAQAAATPQAVALVCGAQRLSYEELNRRANQLAHHLRTLGVGPHRRVAICAQRGVPLLVAVLGTLKAGGAYVPLDPAYPPERLGFMLADSTPVALLAEAACAPRLPVPEALPICLLDAGEALWSGLPTEDIAPRDIGLEAGHPAYVIYTSGSTGTPKGVLATHRGLCNLAQAQIASFCVTPQSRVLQFASFSFDACISEIAMALSSGAELHLPASQGALAGDALVEAIESAGITHVTLPPAVLAALDEAELACVQSLICAGEALPAALARRWAAGRRLFNAYGPTEATVCTSIQQGAPGSGDSVPIGRPMDNMRIHVLDARGRPVPVGASGEIHISGAGVALGYLGRPDLTAERFIPDPYSGVAGARMYRSGDSGRWREDGSVDFLGRVDRQLKLRGFRIEPGEIEAALCTVPGVREAAVLASAREASDQTLLAFMVVQPGAAVPEPAAVRAHLALRLPEHMVPAIFVPIDALPLTPNGKLDTRSLLASHGGTAAQARHELPSGEIETLLADIWADLLDLRRVGRNDNFFESGGHSLLGVRLVSRVRARGFDMTLQDLYTNPTPQLLADCLSGATGRPYGSYAVAVRPQGAAAPLFIVPSGLGNVAYAYTMAAHVDANVPIYGLPWPQQLPASMEALAAHAVALMKSVRPEGPYRLLGVSAGATLAYAIAQHLAQLDEGVEFVGLIDADYTENPPLDEAMRATLTADLLAIDLRRMHGAERYAELAADLEEAIATVDALQTCGSVTLLHERVAALPALQRIGAQIHMSLPERLSAYARIVHFDGLRRLYVAQPLPQCLHLLESTESAVPLGTLGWERAMPQDRIVIHPMPVAHATLFTPRHLGALAQTLHTALAAPRAAAQAEPTLAFPLHRGNAEAPLVVCVPGAGATVTSFLELAAALGEGVEVMAMQPRGIDGAAPAFGSVELAAQRYLEALRASTGPRRQVHLLGHSFGGWAVFEMAQRLAVAGTPAASVTIVDSSAPDREPEAVDLSRAEILERFLEVVAMQAPRAMPLDLAALDRLNFAELLDALHRLFVQLDLMPPRSRAEALRGSLATFATACRTAYRPDLTYTGPVHLALVDDTRLDRDANEAQFLQCRQGWEHLAPDLHTWHGPGNHMTVLQRPHVQALMAWWRACTKA
ncbi:amino acid adenylation domain-containing protein, partial [Variovorax boronicumulans]|uniref:amino acid adenylation domain-containing protein n=1 Tax=Variovorax boronicumulans TaxID=436515 RepID=UPI003399B06C